MSNTRFDAGRTLALIRKELAQIVRDPSTFLIAFILPLLLLFLFGYGVNLDNARSRLGVALLDGGEPALSLAGAYQTSRWFETTTTRSVRPLERMIVDSQIRGFVVIPPDFSEGYARGTPPPIQIVTDGSQPNQAAFTAAYAENLRATWAANEAALDSRPAAPPIALEQRVWYNSQLLSRWFLVPGAIAIVMTMIGTLLTSLVIAREWERGTMEAMMATPMHMAEFLLSKIVPYFVLALISMGLCTLIAIFVFGLPLRGSVFALLLVAMAYLLPALGQGLFISAATKNQFVASQAALLSAFLPTFLLSGFLYEISSMPWPIQAVTYIIPARYLIPALQTVFLAGDIWPLLLPNILAMIGFGAIFLILCVRATRRSLD